MPPLRERREDIPLLADHFIGKYIQRCNMKAKRLSPQAVSCMVNYDWPGNVRELENAIEHAVVLGMSDILEVEDLPESILEKGLSPATRGAGYHNQIKELKRQLILQAVQNSKGNYTDAAENLGVHVNYLHRLIRNLDLKDALRALPSPRPGSETPRRSSRQTDA